MSSLLSFLPIDNTRIFIDVSDILCGSKVGRELNIRCCSGIAAKMLQVIRWS